MKQNSRQRIKRKFTSKMQAKLLLVFCLVILAFIALIGRLMFLNQKDGERYAKKVLSQQTYVSSVIPYKRGDIIDSKGTVLAKSVKVYNLILDPHNVLEKATYKEPTIAALVKCFEMTSEEINEILTTKKDSRYVIVKKKLTYDQVQVFKKLETENNKKEKVNKIEGVWFEDDYIRTYPMGKTACDLIGFTSSGNVGNWGIEEFYNNELNGSNGREYGYFDSELKLERNVKSAVNGNTIISSIDSTIQTIVENNITKFKAEIGGKNVAVVVMNPNNGEIIAMASNENYDLNDPRSLKGFYTDAEIEAMNDEEKLNALNILWRNYCISDNYEPGSTFKPFTVSAALEEGIVTNESTFMCTGVLDVLGAKIHCAKKAGHGLITLKESIAYSCNIAMMDISSRLARTTFSKYQNHFLFGAKTGIDLPGESTGSIFSEAKLEPIELATSSFGQGLTVNMSQMVAGFSSLINGGNYYQPHVVKQIVNENGATVEDLDAQLVKKAISKNTSNLIKEYMYSAVEEGTAKGAQVPGYQIGGKTGTAQKIPRADEKYLVSFIGFAPVENPQMVIYVVIDEPDVEKQANSAIATVFASQIMAEIFPFLEIFPTEEIIEPTMQPTEGGTDAQTPVPNVDEEDEFVNPFETDGAEYDAKVTPDPATTQTD